MYGTALKGVSDHQSQGKFLHKTTNKTKENQQEKGREGENSIRITDNAPSEELQKLL